MSMKLAVQCWELVLTHAEYKILSALCDEADDDGTHCYPGIPYLIWKTGYDERSIQRTLRALQERGWITVVQAASGPGTFTEYAIHLELIPRKTPWRQVKATLADRKRGGRMSPLPARKGGILSPKGGDPVPEGVTGDPIMGGISSTETGDLPDAIAENAIRPVVNPVNDPVNDPIYTAPAREIRAVPKPGALVAAEQADCPAWAALCAAFGRPAGEAAAAELAAIWRDALAWAAGEGLDRAALAALVAATVAAGRARWSVPLTARAWLRHFPTLRAELAGLAGDGPADGAPSAVVAHREATGADDARRAEERAALLARLETDGAAQAWWGEAAARPPRLTPSWREAIFVPPRPDRQACALVFPDDAAAARARASPGLGVAWLRIRAHPGWRGPTLGPGLQLAILALTELDDGTGGDDDGDDTGQQATGVG